MRSRGGWQGVLHLAAFGLVAAAALAVLPPSSDGQSRPHRAGARKAVRARLHFASSGNHSELLKTVPIARHKWDKKRVVMSLGPGKLPTFHKGDVLRTSAEVQISNTCIVFYAARCIGRRYSYSPREDARIVLGSGKAATGGRHAVTIAETNSLRCHQRRPDRNHHCVLVFQSAATKLRHPHHLPCAPDRCHVNLVLEADYRHAHDGQVIIVGADRPDGSVRQDKGRLNAVVVHGKVPPPKRFKTRRRASRSEPIAPTGRSGRRVIYSQRINTLRKGDVLEVSANYLVSISSLPYSTFIGTHVVLATRRQGVVAHAHAEITETNGFNCTFGPSAYRDPCLTKKAGAIRIRHTAARHGHPIPMYVNVVLTGKAKRTTPSAGDRMDVLPRGLLRVLRYRVP